MLITAVGRVERYLETVYRLGEKRYCTKFFPLALAKLLELEPVEEVLVVTTPEMRENYEILREEMSGQGFQRVTSLIVPPAENESSFFGTVLALIDAVPEGEKVILDVTHGFRSLPFVYFVTLLFLDAFRAVSLNGVYYGAFQPEVAESTVVDLTSLFVMARWSQAVETFRTAGNLTFLRKLVSQESSRWCRSDEGRPLGGKLSRLKTALAELDQDLAHCLPLEAGLEIHRLLGSIQFEPSSQGYEALLARIFGELEAELAPFRVTAQAKESIVLSTEELKRQLGLARWYTRHGAPDHALIILGEWLISRVLMAGGGQDWLDYNQQRARARAKINAFNWKYLDQLSSVDPDAKLIGILGQSIGDLRNKYAHAGMTSDKVKPKTKSVEDYMDQCEELLEADLTAFSPSPDVQRLLIVPYGLAPGILYSAIASDQNEYQGYLVILSAQSQPKLLETLAAIDRLGRPVPADRIYQLLLTDPHGQFFRQDDLFSLSLHTQNGRSDFLANYLALFDQISGCMTGGTTAMQYLVERILDLARQLGVWETQRFALIDRRPLEEQRMNPYIVGERVELDRRKESEV